MTVENKNVGVLYRSHESIAPPPASTPLPKKEKTIACKDVDIEFYGKFYPDLSSLNTEQLITHWKTVGHKENRFCNPKAALKSVLSDSKIPNDFNVKSYLSLNPDVAEECEYECTAVQHYLNQGIGENRLYIHERTDETLPTNDDTSHCIDVAFYRSYYPDLAHLNDYECINHWQTTGKYESRLVSTENYLDDLQTTGQLPEGFNIPSYIGENPDLVSVFKHAWKYVQHYLNTGISEKRTYKTKKVDEEYLWQKYKLSLYSDISSTDIISELKKHTKKNNVYHFFLNESELFRFNGISDTTLLEHFDHETYIYENTELSTPLRDYNRAQCLEHFIEFGIDNVYQISSDYWFDAEFYYNEYKQDLPYLNQIETSSGSKKREFSSLKTQLYKHWISQGNSENKMPNIRIWTQKTLGFLPPLKINEILENYKNANYHDIEKKNPTAVFEHYIFYGIIENRVGVVYNDETCNTYCQVAKIMALQEKRTKTIMIYEQILQRYKTHPVALHSLSDELLKCEFYGQAIKGYKKIINQPEATQWSYINLAKSYKSLNDYANAARSLSLGTIRFPNDTYLINQSKILNCEYFETAYERAKKLGKQGNIAQGQKFITTALKHFPIPSAVKPTHSSSKKVAIIGNYDLSQCRLYRIDQKIQQLKQAGYSVDAFQHTSKLDFYNLNISEYFAVIFYRVPALPNIIDAINIANTNGVPTIYDIDDLIFDTDLFPPPLDTYSGLLKKEQHALMAIDVPLNSHAISLCRYGLASTPTLANAMKKIIPSGNVYLHRNGLSKIHYKYTRNHQRKNNTDVTTVFYGSGTKAHKNDFYNILLPAISQLHSKYKTKIRFLIIGKISKTKELEKLGNSLVLLEPTHDTEYYWNIMREEADINIAVLSSSTVTDSKSEIKWMEAAMMSIPSVVSNTATYSEIIDDGITGMICSNSTEFYNSIDKLISNKPLRSKIGNAAYKQVQNNYSIPSLGKNIDSILKTTRPQKNESKIKLAVVNVFYPPESIGGATRVVFDNVNEFSKNYKNQIEVRVFCSSSGESSPYTEKNYSINGVNVTTVRCSNKPNAEHALSDANMGKAFNKFLDEFQPDIVHFHCIQKLTESVVTETRSLGIPYIITAHDGWWISDQQFLIGKNEKISLYNYEQSHLKEEKNTKGRAKILKNSIFSAESILSVSEEFSKLYKISGIPNVRVIENGVSSINPLPKEPNPNNKIRLAHIGGTERHKGLHLIKYALKSSKLINNMELLVIDHAAEPGSIRKEKWGNVEVTFKPKVPQNSVFELYNKIDVLIAPSVWPESYGLVSREALLCGCWVITSDRGAIGADIKHNKNGYVVNIDTPEPLRDVLESIDSDIDRYSNPPEYKSIIRSNSDQAQELVSVYKKIFAIKKSRKSIPA